MNDDLRADPDKLLKAIQRHEGQQKRGKLKIFLGMAAGVGKTYAMLEAARKQQSLGVDVVIGYVETHGRKDTNALLVGLPVIPPKESECRGVKLSEIDVDAVLARKPRLAIVDELAHANAPESRHPKRYQDIHELLDAGIDVYTTLNVQHVESRAQTVEEITGSTMHETVPDSVLDMAEIELIDISPEDLMRRLDEGKVYLPDRAAVAMVNFFREGNLAALREMALRLAAERVGQDVHDYMQVMQIQGPWKTGHRLLVAVSPSPFSAQMVRWTRRLADSLDAPWMAVHVESSKALSEADQARLTKNLNLARDLGAEVIATADEDVVRGVVRVARQHNSTQIVVGKPAISGWHRFLGASGFLRRLVAESGDIDIHVVRAEKSEIPATQQIFRMPAQVAWKQYLIAFAAIVATTLVNELLKRVLGYHAVGFLFLLMVVTLALFVGRGPILFAAALSAVFWDYFFIPPALTMHVGQAEDIMMLAMYFVVALGMGELNARFRKQEKAERQREERTAALYMLTRELADVVTLEQIVKVAISHIDKLFKAEAAVVLAEPDGKLSPLPTLGSTMKLSDKELSVASWVFQHNTPAGRFTENLPLSGALYLPLTAPGGTLGVIGVGLPLNRPLNLEQNNLLEALVRQTALVIDRQRLHDAAQQAQLAAESERLSKTLLDSISHEMRTPIAAIGSAANALSDPKTSSQPGFGDALLDEIRVAGARLNRLVGNLLDIARVESGHVKPKMDWCDVGDLVNVSVKSVQREMSGHNVEVTLHPAIPLVRMDFVLMEQALVNLLLNAAFHTPSGTPVQIIARVEKDELALTVADRGRGIPQESLGRIFEKFYRAPGAVTGGTGLGLSIVKGFVEAQGGRVEAANRPDGGAAFSLYLPITEQPIFPEENA